MAAMTKRYRVITHNLANANTAGFKRRVSTFVQGGGQATGPGGAMAGKITDRGSIDFTQGALARTGRALDLGLQGKGFFVIETPDGPLYTRHGIFQVSAERRLVDSVGRTVSGQGGPITIPAGSSASGVQISSDGQISGRGLVIGQLKIVEFEQPGRLTSAGLACFRAPANVRPRAATATTVHQGVQESSNVSVVGELISLITVTRLYQANMRSIKVQDDRMASILRVAMA
jgi:flagellar basal body rod protein FlgG